MIGWPWCIVNPVSVLMWCLKLRHWSVSHLRRVNKLYDKKEGSDIVPIVHLVVYILRLHVLVVVIILPS